MPITMSQAERLICEHLSKGGETASARLRSQRTFFDFIAEGMLHPTSSQGEVHAFRVYPPDEQHPARLLYDWDSPQEVWAAPALVNILDEFDFDEGTMITLPSDTSSDAFPWPWRGGPFVLRVNAEGKAVMGREAVVISLKGVTVDRSELLRCIALWEEDSKAQPTDDQVARAGVKSADPVPTEEAPNSGALKAKIERALEGLASNSTKSRVILKSLLTIGWEFWPTKTDQECFNDICEKVDGKHKPSRKTFDRLVKHYGFKDCVPPRGGRPDIR